jgi:hypothetical protein
MFGVFEQTSPMAAVLGLPIALWELTLGFWLAFKGFKKVEFAALMAKSNS